MVGRDRAVRKAGERSAADRLVGLPMLSSGASVFGAKSAMSGISSTTTTAWVHWDLA
jgi:hypothetical protein